MYIVLQLFLYLALEKVDKSLKPFDWSCSERKDQGLLGGGGPARNGGLCGGQDGGLNSHVASNHMWLHVDSCGPDLGLVRMLGKQVLGTFPKTC